MQKYLIKLATVSNQYIFNEYMIVLAESHAEASSIAYKNLSTYYGKSTVLGHKRWSDETGDRQTFIDSIVEL